MKSVVNLNKHWDEKTSNDFPRLSHIQDKFVTDWAERVKLGDNLKTTSKMPDGNTGSQSKAVRHFGHPLAVLANVVRIIFGSRRSQILTENKTTSTSDDAWGHSVKAIGLLQ
jgi:uncharacterized lipoprotein